jgi:hypothetical protein
VAPHLSNLLGLTLVRNGDYPRLLPLESHLVECSICRKKCSGCRISFSLLPNDVVPLHSYGLQLISDRVRASLAGQPDKSREFYEIHELLPDEPEIPSGLKATSWSDRLNDEPPRPSPQLFSHWRRKWSAQATAWLRQLLLACLLVGADLKGKLADRLLEFYGCPKSMRAVPFAIGLVSLLHGSDAALPISRTVFLLGCRPSHKICRAAGRPPPQYGGDLELGSPQESPKEV